MSKMLILNMTSNRSSKELSTPELAAAGFLSAVPTTLVTAPVERAKVLLQVRRPRSIRVSVKVPTFCSL